MAKSSNRVIRIQPKTEKPLRMANRAICADSWCTHSAGPDQRAQFMADARERNLARESTQRELEARRAKTTGLGNWR